MIAAHSAAAKHAITPLAAQLAMSIISSAFAIIYTTAAAAWSIANHIVAAPIAVLDAIAVGSTLGAMWD